MNGSKPTLLGQYCLLCGLANFALKNSHFTFTNLASTLVAAVGVVVQIQFICVLLQSFCCYCLCFVFCMGHKHVSVFLNCHQMVCRGDMVAMACSYFLFLTQPDWFFFLLFVFTRWPVHFSVAMASAAPNFAQTQTSLSRLPDSESGQFVGHESDPICPADFRPAGPESINDLKLTGQLRARMQNAKGVIKSNRSLINDDRAEVRRSH